MKKKKKEKKTLLKLKRQNQGLGMTRQMVGTVEELKHRFFQKSIGSRFLKLQFEPAVYVVGEALVLWRTPSQMRL